MRWYNQLRDVEFAWGDEAFARRAGAWRAPACIPHEEMLTEENVERNGVTARIAVLEGNAEELLPLVAPVRLILANIISSVLVELLPLIAESVTTDGVVILSGILVEERARMLEVLAAEGWRVEAEDAEDQWWSVRVSR